MCGIVGFIVNNDRHFDIDSTITKMSKKLTHRGPDDSGFWTDKFHGIALGHTRLSILDLSNAGHQPIHSSCGRYTMTFNGEIYNHIEIRGMLHKEHGVTQSSFSGSSDTETLITAFSYFGIERTLDLISGMFAIALFDKHENKLCLIRDRMGEKPLYFGWSKGSFLFSSELKSLKEYPDFDNKIDRDVVALYMRYLYIPAPYSIYKNIYKLEPGCILKIDISNMPSAADSALFSDTTLEGISIKKWWSLSKTKSNAKKESIDDEKVAVDSLNELLLHVVNSQSHSDVNIGAFLSGGVDSTLIASLMQHNSVSPIDTFTIGFEDQDFNEAVYAKQISDYLGTRHHEYYLSSKDMLDVVPKMQYIYDEPFADSSQVATYLISKIAKQKVTVSLSGDGGDEVFGGYNRYIHAPKLWRGISWIPSKLRNQLFHIASASSFPLRMVNLYSRNLINRPFEKINKLSSRMKYVHNKEDLYHSLVSEWQRPNDVVLGSSKLPTSLEKSIIESPMQTFEENMMYWDSISYLPDDILCKVDRASMSNGLEVRVPFLDRKIIEFASRIPLSMKINNGESKWILRQVLSKYVPMELIDRPKSGFSIPVGDWMKNSMLEWSEDLLSPERIISDGYFDNKKVQKIWKEHVNNKKDWSASLWSILMFNSWLDGNK
jgi:asparagine synthase (glutamine-hydrolysing)